MSVRGVTTNPSIFEGAIAGSADAYAEQIAALAQSGVNAEQAVRLITSDDVRSACDNFRRSFHRIRRHRWPSVPSRLTPG